MTEGTRPANADQTRSWNGPGGEFWAAHADRYDRMTAAYLPPLLEAAAAGPRDRVLDVGCGNGVTAVELARRAGSVLGVDLSDPMLAVARKRAAARGLSGATFLRADAQVHPFPPGAFDVVASRHGTLFFDDPAAAFANLAGALRPGGRMVLLAWQPAAAQEWLVELLGALRAPLPDPDTPGPVSLGDPVRIRHLLDGAGLTAVDVTGVDRPVWWGDDADDAATFAANHYGGRLDPDDRAVARDALRAVTAEHETADGVLFRSACWLVTARRAPIRT